jgi:CHAT domain-containing protein/Tfp pilus assembly protein PilF
MMAYPGALNLSLFGRGLRLAHRSLTLLVSLLIFSNPVLITRAYPTPSPSPISDNSKGQQEGERDANQLELGKPIEREIAGGQSHRYQIRLSANQYLHVIVDQRGVDLVVALLQPDGKKVVEVDGPNGPVGPEPLKAISEAEGVYLLEIHPLQKSAAAGRYQVKVIELKTATERERQLVEAFNFIKKLEILQLRKVYAEAITAAQKALAISERWLGPDHPEVIDLLNRTASLYRAEGDYDNAEKFYRRALTVREKKYGPEHSSIAYSYNSLAILYEDKGEYAQAEQFYQRALAIRQKALGPEHPSVLTLLYYIASFYHDHGDYPKAEERYLQLLEIRKKVNGLESLEVAAAVNNLAILYRDKGDYTLAEQMFRRALAMREKALGPDHIVVAGSLNNRASLYRDRGENAKAEPIYLQAMKIREKVLGPYHTEVAASLNNLAVLYRDLGDYAKAESLNNRALSIREKALGMEHTEVAVSLNNLAVLYRDLGDYAKAEPLFLRALAIREKAQEPYHPSIARLLNNLSILYAANGEIDRAIEYQARAAAIHERGIALNIMTGSERQKLAYLATLSEESDRILSLHLRSAPNDPAARRLAATIILQRKGRALDAMTDGLAALRRRSDPQEQALLDRFKSTRSHLAYLMFGASQKIPPEERQKQIKILQEQNEKLEAEIGRRSEEFELLSETVTPTAVQAAIPADAALIEFAVFRPFNPRYSRPDDAFGKPHYAAYLLRRQGEIQWIELGDKQTIDEAVGEFRKALRNPKQTDVKQLARSVDEKVMYPVRALLGKTRRAFLSPDGALNLVPFAALVDENGRHLVERYSFSYLSSGRDLLRKRGGRMDRESPDKGQTIVVAAPAFGEAPQTVTGQNRDAEQESSSRAPEAGSERLPRMYFPPLPGTAEEARGLKGIMPNAILFTNEQATEARLKRLSGPMILHVATHGFFLKDLGSRQTGTRDVILGSSAPPADVQVEDPLLRSGLALAGANLLKSGEEDGVLTALEAAGLDLWGTKLVVLSACDTGVGEVKTGEGVYGLRRALALAGSESQVMSLWPVSDTGARDLMIDYYRALQRGEGRAEALRQVQLQMLRSKERRHPFYWAGFIQSGEWASLEGRRGS